MNNQTKSIIGLITAIAVAAGAFMSKKGSDPQPTRSSQNTTTSVRPQQGKDSEQPTPRGGTTQPAGKSKLTYRGKPVIITKHGSCRMDCRRLDAFEVQEVLDKGRVNERKTDRSAQPCPTIALEGRTRDGQTARVVVAECDSEVKIVTVIDLDNDYKCDCY